MKLFSRFSKDYHNLLEEILDEKTFSSISKSLLFSMIYKLEISYKDYGVVKPWALRKDEFLSYLLDCIQKYCDHIKTVEPESVGAELLIKYHVDAVTNVDERSILVYPTEQAMLYAICDIEPKYFFAKQDFIFKHVLQKVLVEGYKQNTLEILQNFNGWSWDISSNAYDDYVINLIYQNLLMMKGEKFLFDWRTDSRAQKNYLAELKRSIKNVTGNHHYYLSFCKLLYKIASKKEKVEITKFLKEKEDLYQECLKQGKSGKSELVQKMHKFKMYHDILKNHKSAYEELLELQKCFLEFLEKKVEKMTVKEEILEVIYMLRYYQNTLLSERVLIKENPDLAVHLDLVMKQVLTKACQMGILKMICVDREVNFELLKYILDTRIIDLQDIKISIQCEKQEIFVEIYDREVFEKQGKIAFQGNRKDVVLKKKRMVNLFN